jgi:hypothetical protein
LSQRRRRSASPAHSVQPTRDGYVEAVVPTERVNPTARRERGPVSNLCHTRHWDDIQNENATFEMRIDNSCRFLNRVSSPSSLTCSDAKCLT